MNEYSILVVDDDVDLCEILKFNLERQGYKVQVAHSAIDAMKLMTNFYNLIIIDVMMPGMSGFDFAQKLKEDGIWAKMPIIFLTAKDGENDVLKGFEIGADDYIAKPFSIKEVMARVKAVLARSHGPHTDPLLSLNGLVIDSRGKTVMIDGFDAELTKTEYELLLFLLQHRGRVFSREELLNHVWPNNVVVTLRTVDVNITRLRKKMGRFASYILTKTGYGYSFEL